MMESLDFRFDNVYSKDMNVINVNSSNGLFEESFFPDRTIVEQSAYNRDKPYHIRVDEEPLSFSLRLYFDRNVDSEYLRRIVRWLYQDYYKPLIFESNLEKVYYAILEGSSSLTHNGLGQAYIDVNVRCDAPYGYSHEHIVENIKYRDENNQQDLKVDVSNFEDSILENLELMSGGRVKINTVSTWGQYAPNLYVKWGDKI